ncbi:MAG: hypothetical protein ABI723_00980 [Bacteroidia bacterium]
MCWIWGEKSRFVGDNISSYEKILLDNYNVDGLQGLWGAESGAEWEF